MHVYDSIIIGSGYSAVGYTIKNGNTITLEESHTCDTQFYLPLKSFIHTEYKPVTPLGIRLDSHFNKYGLFKDGYMCTNGFEPAFCEFISKESVDILLKCKVISVERLDDGICKVTIFTAEGFSTVYAKNVFDSKGTKDHSKKYLTVLFVTENGESDIKKLSAVFDGSTFTKAFYDTRYVMHLPLKDIIDVNEAISYIDDKWKTADTDAKVLYIPPVFCFTQEANESTFPKDQCFSNPIAAFEAGILFNGGEE
ncbi:MAG: hypothetical protein IKM06_05605 [Clostridia bacterium]|nr:hypothetical protein [Clostridia bacterium]